MGDVGERAGVNEGRAAFDRLDQVRLDRLAHQHGHRARDLELLERDRLARVVLGDDHPTQSLTQVLEVARQREDGHDLRRRGDVPLRFAHVRLFAQADLDAPQRAVVDVDDARPANGLRVDAQLVAAEEVVVEEGRAQVVRGGDGVEVAGEVDVDLLHRQDLAVAAACGAALEAEDRAKAGLADRSGRTHADPVEALGEPDGRCRLAFAERRWRDRRYDDLLAVRLVCAALVGDRLDLGLVRAVQVELVVGQAQLARDCRRSGAEWLRARSRGSTSWLRCSALMRQRGACARGRP